MKFLWATIICFLIHQYSYALEIVYPKIKNPTINSPTTFFIGSSNTPLKINGKNVPRHKTGAFAYFVNLPFDKNIFTIETNEKIEIYTIFKNFIPPKTTPQKFIEYDTIKAIKIIKDNTPLRNTPINSGMNRLSHLPKETLLISDGEKNSFYRVKLSDKKYAWINKSNAISTKTFTPAIIQKQTYKETPSSYELQIQFDKKIPFIIKEKDFIELEFFNTNKKTFFKIPYKEKTNTTQLYGYQGKYINNTFILKINKPPKVNPEKPLNKITIAIDAGHGGKENGAIGCLGDKEKNINLNIAKYLKKELENRGANVIMTRNDDSFISLVDRINISNKNNAMFFISIHNNALPDTLNPNNHRGTSIYYYYEQAKPLAEKMLEYITKELNTSNDNIHQQSLAVIRNSYALSILIEIAYMINPDDNELLIDQNFQKKAAIAICNGLENFILYNTTPKP